VNYKASVIIEKDDDGFYAYCPELQGCHTQADTFEKAIVNIKEAVSLYVETLSRTERKALFSKEVYSTSLEIKVA
jgi:predicted RNase H-like HicB family nuclease